MPNRSMTEDDPLEDFTRRQVTLDGVEKLVYVVVWVIWHSGNSLAQLYSKDVFAGVFFNIYGINDFVFMLFFAWVFFFQRPTE